MKLCSKSPCAVWHHHHSSGWHLWSPGHPCPEGCWKADAVTACIFPRHQPHCGPVRWPVPQQLQTRPLPDKSKLCSMDLVENAAAPHSCTFRGSLVPWGDKYRWLQQVLTRVWMDSYCKWSSDLIEYSSWIIFECSVFVLSFFFYPYCSVNQNLIIFVQNYGPTTMAGQWACPPSLFPLYW